MATQYADGAFTVWELYANPHFTVESHHLVADTKEAWATLRSAAVEALALPNEELVQDAERALDRLDEGLVKGAPGDRIKLFLTTWLVTPREVTDPVEWDRLHRRSTVEELAREATLLAQDEDPRQPPITADTVVAFLDDTDTEPTLNNLRQRWAAWAARRRRQSIEQATATLTRWWQTLSDDDQDMLRWRLAEYEYDGGRQLPSAGDPAAPLSQLAQEAAEALRDPEQLMTDLGFVRTPRDQAEGQA